MAHRAGHVLRGVLAVSLFLSVAGEADAATAAIESGPPFWTNQTSASFVVGPGPTELRCRLDGGAWNSCLGELSIPGPLAEGEHVLDARTAGAAGPPEDSWVWRIDLTPPTAAEVNEPAYLWQARRNVPVGWAASDSASGVQSFALRYDLWLATGPFHANVPWFGAASATGATFRATPGRTYCHEARARDRAGNESPSWSPGRCFAVPLDERGLDRSTGSWSSHTGDLAFLGGYAQTRERGAWLREEVVGRRLALLATTCPACGSVRVLWRGRPVRRINLGKAGPSRTRFIAITTLPGRQRGTLRVEVTSAGERVRIDGLGVSGV